MPIRPHIPLHDVDMLSAVFEELLEDHQILRASTVAEGTLTRLIFNYDLGIRDPALLKVLTVPFLRQRLSGTQ
ncbi:MULTISPECIES: hypothetical protein [unclassified Sinorhizobium]|uniref:hypothetical protein n=1 Tax=unclassified Sinorhizobium TaxID=2613772 RepID=UPI0024C22B7F|nr:MULTISPECIES: hypothetical protein [unclassified Sinorhizobium]MDK1373458.1 hypothetical protein [Sinorhizobium sp. 6-70]MDK1482391.1 hypothetical protein [Sinorhizobium sp. 6-117]